MKEVKSEAYDNFFQEGSVDFTIPKTFSSTYKKFFYWSVKFEDILHEFVQEWIELTAKVLKENNFELCSWMKKT